MLQISPESDLFSQALEELAGQAQEQGHRLLAYLLGMAALEAANIERAVETEVVAH